MVKTRSRAINLKKEGKFKKEHLYLILFIVLGMFFLSLINYNGNGITGSAVNIGNTIGGALDLFGQVLEPLFNALGSDRNSGVFSRVIIMMLLFIIIKSLSGITKLFKKRDEEGGERNANIIIGIISLIGAIAIPPTLLTILGGTVLLGLFIAGAFGMPYLIYMSAKGDENKMIYFLKGAFSLIAIVAIAALKNLLNIPSISSEVSNLFDLAEAIGIAICVVFVIRYLFFKTLTGGVTSLDEGLPDTRELRDTGRFYGGVLGKAIKGAGKGFLGLGKIFGKGAKATGKGIYSGGKWVKGKIRPDAEQDLKNRLNNAIVSGTKFIKKPEDEDNFYVFIRNLNFLFQMKYVPGTNFKDLMS